MMRTRSLLIVTGLFALAVGLLSAALGHYPVDHRSAAAGLTNAASLARQTEILAAYGKLPLDFEQNQGQSDPRVRFVARGNGYTLFFTGTDATLLLEATSASPNKQLDRYGLFPPVSARRPSEEQKSAVLRLSLEGSNHVAGVSGLDLQPGRSNYFIGNKPEQWHRNVPHYARVKYERVYPGIDLIYYGNQGQLESDYVVSPGADPNRIALHIDGAEHLDLDSLGNLVLATTGGDLSLHRPIAYQEDAGTRKPVAAHYILRGTRSVGIEVASYDSRQPLIIDPVVVYSTYLGGSSNDLASAIAVDPQGNAYMTGWTQSTDFVPAATPGFQKTWPMPSVGNAHVVFVAKLNPTGSGLVYATYLGGTGSASVDQGFGIALDSNKDAFVAGTTAAFDFPHTPNAYQTQDRSNSGGTAFLTELDPSGSSLLYSTFVGGTGAAEAHAVAVDASGLAYITGVTTTSDFPTTPNGIPNSGTTCSSAGLSTGSLAYVSKFNTTAVGIGSLIYSTLLGGTCAQAGNAIAVDSNAVAYIGGITSSTDFPVTPINFQSQELAGTGGNAFVAKIDTTLTGQAGLLYATLIGGTGSTQGGGDIIHGLALGPGLDVFVVGSSGSTDFPTTATAFQRTTSSTVPKTAFIARFNTTATTGPASLVYSTYLGDTGAGGIGSGFSQGNGIVVDPQDNAYIAGNTTADSFPITAGAPQPTRKGQNTYVSVLNPTGTGLIFSTYWGGEASDVAFGMAIDKNTPPNIYFAGSTSSGTFPIVPNPGAFQVLKNGVQDAFVSKLTPAAAATGVTLLPGSLAFGNQPVNTTSTALSATLTNNGSSQVTGILITITGNNPNDFTQTAATTCGAALAASAKCTISIDFTPKSQAAESATLDVATSAGPLTVALTGTGTSTAGIVSVNPPNVSFGTISIGTTSAAQTVTLTNNTTTTLAGIAITITGANMTDFNPAAGTTCTPTATLAAAANCTIAVTFKPTLSSLESATLNIAFTGPTGSPQQVLLSGTGTTATPDFSIVASPPSATITVGQTAMFTLTVTSMNGFSSAVTAACTGAPGGSTCMLTPTSVTPAPNGTATISGSLATKAETIPPLLRFTPAPRLPIGVWGLLTVVLALLAAWTATRRATRKLAFAFGLLAILSLSGCSGLPHTITSTQKGTYTITVNATSGALKHPATVSITVN
jgi:hypothetical protein